MVKYWLQVGRDKVNKWLILVFTFFLIGKSNAQSVNNKPLREVLDSLEVAFDVRFSYMDRTIDSIEVLLPNKELALEGLLELLEEQAAIEFIKLDDRFYSIVRRKTKVSICGYLLDSDNTEPIVNALIFNKTLSAITDDNGFFELQNAPDSLNFEISHIAYQSKKISLNGRPEDCLRIYLKPAIEYLRDVVIQNYVARGIDKMNNGATRIDVQNANILPGLTEPDVFFTLQNLPGVQSLNETVTDLNIRGGSNDQNLVLWDGLRLYQTGHFFGLISSINPHVIQRTTLIKNGTTAKLGEGVSGTIEVESRESNTNTGIVQAGTNLLNSEFLLELPIKRLHMLVASRQSTGSYFDTPTYAQYFERVFSFSDVVNDPNSQVINSNEAFSFYDFSVNLSYELSTSAKIKGGLILLNNGISYEETDLVNSEVESKVSNLDQSTSGGYLSFSKHWSNRFKTNVYSSMMNYKQESVNFDVLTGQEYILENEILETAFRANAFIYVNDSWDFEAGVHFLETGIRNLRDINIPQFRFLQRDVIRTISIYGESNTSIGTHTNITAGVRASYFEGIQRYRIEPRLSVNTRLGEAFSVEFLAEAKSQTTIQAIDFQTDFLGVENRKWELVNGESIPLLTSGQSSLAVNFQKDSWLVSLEGFLKKVNGVYTSSQGFLNQFEYERSTGSYVSSGLELLINPSFGRLNSWATYSYLNSDYSFPDLSPSEFRNNYDITHTFSLGFAYELHGLELSTGINYRTGVPFTEAIGLASNNEIIFGFPNELELPSYFRMDFSAKYKFKLSQRLMGNFGVAIWNLTNHDNRIKTLTSVTSNNELVQINQRALGFTPNLSIRLLYQF